jgi:hypothetical protein
MKRKRIVVMGFMAGMPIAGVIWQHIHYIVGLQRLGHDVYYIEDSGRIAYDPVAQSMTVSTDYAANILQKLATEFGFEQRWAYCARYLDEQPVFGCSRKKMLQLYRDADAILNVCGAQEFNQELLVSDRIIYIESDPGVEQIKVAKRNRDTIEYLRRHRALFTFGENVGTPKFPVPTRGFTWLPTRQPVVLDFWNTSRPPAPGAVFTTVANWNTSGLKDIEWRGEKYLWSKSREFLRFIKAPQRAAAELAVATGINHARTRERFLRNGWRLDENQKLSADHHRYRNYLRRSKGEFTVAKDQYVRLNTGWFSDRSACYLAAGRPVITQETGFTRIFGQTAGLFGFHSLGEIAEAVREISADYSRHSRAAREIAREFFHAEKVIGSLLERAGI